MEFKPLNVNLKGNVILLGELTGIQTSIRKCAAAISKMERNLPGLQFLSEMLINYSLHKKLHHRRKKGLDQRMISCL